MSRKRYTVKRGNRAEHQFDVMIFDKFTLRFAGKFYPEGKRQVTDDDQHVIDAIKFAVEQLT